MMNELLSVLEDQSLFQFTGKTALLDSTTKEELGMIWQRQGVIIAGSFQGQRSKKAVLNLALTFHDFPKKYLVNSHPEVIADVECETEWSFESFKMELTQAIALGAESRKLKPPGHLRLTPHPDFLLEGAPVSGDEFDLLCTISEFSKVEVIYQESSLLEHEVTRLLISLRKKKALKVLGV